MTEFMTKDFLLDTDTAKVLYHDYAAKLPIIDYHCHVSPKEIYEDLRFENITQLWLYGDHYKWRLMRSNGVSEEYITGKNTSDSLLSFYPRLSETQCIIGATLSLRDTSATRAYSMPKLPKRYGM